MRIAYFVDHLRPDGTQHVLRQLVHGLAKKGHKQFVICLNDSLDTRFVDSLIAAGAKVEVIGRPRLLSGFGLIKIRRILNRERFDVVVTFLFFADVIGRIMARISGVPIVITAIHARDFTYSEIKHLLLRKTAPLADAVVLCSSTLRSYASLQLGVRDNQLWLIHNSIPERAPGDLTERINLRAQFALPPDAVVAGCVGRLYWQKGYDVLLDALALVNDPRLFVFIAGEGDLLDELQSRAAFHGLADRVRFIGYIRYLPGFLAQLDLFIHPSRYEGMPLAVLEAMASGRPIVATAVDGIIDLIDEPETGWLVPPGDAIRLADKIREVIGLPVERQARPWERAKQHALTGFSEEKMIAEWEMLLETLCFGSRIPDSGNVGRGSL